MFSADYLNLWLGPAQVQALWGCIDYGIISYNEGLSLFPDSDTTPRSDRNPIRGVEGLKLRMWRSWGRPGVLSRRCRDLPGFGCRDWDLGFGV